MQTDRMDETKRQQLLQDGYCIMENILTEEMLRKLTESTERLLSRQSREDAETQRSTGSMIPVDKDPLFAELIAWPAALQALARLGYGDPRFTSGYIISKPPQSPPLFWHYDYAAWDDPDAFGEVPQQIFLMYYLVDTTPDNGCLRLIPGTHVRDNPLHEQLEEAHSQGLRRAENMANPAFSVRPDEVNVPIRAGDLVIGDSRLLHASHANRSNSRRTVITLWFHPEMRALHESVQAFIAKMAMPAPQSWPDDAKTRYEPLRAAYDGPAAPLRWNRNRPNGKGRL